MPNRCFPQTPGCCAPAAGFRSGPPQNTCFTVFSVGPSKRRVFSSLGRYGSEDQSCHVPGASWPSKSSQKCPTDLAFAVPFGVLVRRSRFLCFLCRFLEGPTLDPLAQAQSKRSLSLLFGVASKKVLFLQQLLADFWCIWRRNPLK